MSLRKEYTTEKQIEVIRSAIILNQTVSKITSCCYELSRCQTSIVFFIAD